MKLLNDFFELTWNDLLWYVRPHIHMDNDNRREYISQWNPSVPSIRADLSGQPFQYKQTPRWGWLAFVQSLTSTSKLFGLFKMKKIKQNFQFQTKFVFRFDLCSTIGLIILQYMSSKFKLNLEVAIEVIKNWKKFIKIKLPKKFEIWKNLHEISLWPFTSTNPVLSKINHSNIATKI